ncbi:hypothetical protein HYZ98_04490 [Candidatus Peregrinibacteria bacterium]|nr:hypothetical protein [Candidatus Peregrinibacteria bacterium]
MRRIKLTQLTPMMEDQRVVAILGYYRGVARNYYQLLPYTFKRFSILASIRTGFPTLKYYLTRTPLPSSPKPALFTMNILPPMMTVWYHFVRKYLGDKVDTVIFDCSGRLNPADFPHARVQKFLNFYAATKSDEFLYHIAKYRKTGWICDDDMFPLSPRILDILEREFSIPDTASVSFRPRDWWHFEINGKQYEPSSSYCTAINREIYIDKEHLSLSPCDGNTHPSRIGQENRRYDTFDKANEILLQKGYRCAIVPKQERDGCVTGFTGMAGAVMLLSYFKNPDQTLAYFLDPPKSQWQGNMLFGVLASMLSVCTIQELYQKLTGKRYLMPSLPKRSDLEKLRSDHKKYIRSDLSFDRVNETSQRLWSAL